MENEKQKTRKNGGKYDVEMILDQEEQVAEMKGISLEYDKRG